MQRGGMDKFFLFIAHRECPKIREETPFSKSPKWRSISMCVGLDTLSPSDALEFNSRTLFVQNEGKTD